MVVTENALHAFERMDFTSETAWNVAMSWRPIVTGSAADPLREVLAEILVAENPDRSFDAQADRAIVRAYTQTGDPAADITALVDRLDTQHVALFGGATRIGWTLSHLADGVEVQLVCDAIDRALSADRFAGEGYDLISGLVGFGVYALERGPAGLPVLEQIVEALGARAVLRHGGLAWPDDSWNLGLAHGVPGVIAMCARASAAGVTGARDIVDRATTYLATVAHAPYPAREGETARERLAWCYGDLGIASALLGAGLWLDDDRLRGRGLDLALRCAGLGLANVGVRDASFCHGAAGNAHLFNRMAQATGESRLADAARAWLGRLLELRTTAPIAGFPHRLEGDVLAPSGTLITGAPGVGLILHAAITEQEPCWDRLFLIDLPVQVRN